MFFGRKKEEKITLTETELKDIVEEAVPEYDIAGIAARILAARIADLGVSDQLSEGMAERLAKEAVMATKALIKELK